MKRGRKDNLTKFSYGYSSGCGESSGYYDGTGHGIGSASGWGMSYPAWSMECTGRGWGDGEGSDTGFNLYSRGYKPGNSSGSDDFGYGLGYGFDDRMKID